MMQVHREAVFAIDCLRMRKLRPAGQPHIE
jgi:hypothetical protein